LPLKSASETVLPVLSVSVKPGAGAPMRACAAGLAVPGTQVRPKARLAAVPAKPAASSVRRFISSMRSLLVRGSEGSPALGRAGDAVQLAQHYGGGEDLRQDDGLGAAGIEQIERHAAAAVLLQHAGDVGVAAGPVALEIGDAPRGKGGPDGGIGERGVLVDEAGDAPGRRHVDEDGTIGRQ